MAESVINEPDMEGKMQTKEQGKSPRDWKVIAAVATASALGLSGLALADSDSRTDTPDPINLEDRTPITEVTVAKTSTTLADLGVRVSSADSASSPFDEPAAPPVTMADSVASVGSAASPEPAPAPAVQPAADSVDSADSPDDSGDSAGSVDNSADS
ncbi:MAG TPA: hypothetical protein VLA91_00065 [Acidimicrobiia bacterium]|nr:hypothetical protein [Acidimicrobiia bacterium]